MEYSFKEMNMLMISKYFAQLTSMVHLLSLSVMLMLRTNFMTSHPNT